MTYVFRKRMVEYLHLFQTGNKFTDRDGILHEFSHFVHCKWEDSCKGCAGKIMYIDGETGKVEKSCFGVTDGVTPASRFLIREIFDNYFKDDEFLV